MKNLKGRVAAITGASSGIGRALASHSRLDALAETAGLAAKEGVKVTCQQVDVARRVLIGPDARSADFMQRLMPGLYQPIITTGMAWMNRQVAAQERQERLQVERPGARS